MGKIIWYWFCSWKLLVRRRRRKEDYDFHASPVFVLLIENSRRREKRGKKTSSSSPAAGSHIDFPIQFFSSFTVEKMGVTRWKRNSLSNWVLLLACCRALARVFVAWCWYDDDYGQSSFLSSTEIGFHCSFSPSRTKGNYIVIFFWLLLLFCGVVYNESDA